MPENLVKEASEGRRNKLATKQVGRECSIKVEQPSHSFSLKDEDHGLRKAVKTLHQVLVGMSWLNLVILPGMLRCMICFINWTKFQKIKQLKRQTRYLHQMTVILLSQMVEKMIWQQN